MSTAKFEEEINRKKTANQSSGKMLAVMECLAEKRLPMRLQEIAAALHMSQPTVLRYLNAMIQTDYAYQEEGSGRYGLTLKICSITEQLNNHLQLRNVSSGIINEIGTDLNVGVCIVAEDMTRAVYVDLVDDPYLTQNMQTLRRIGKSAPMYSTSSGKLLLSAKSDYELERYMDTVSFEQLTPYTVSSVSALREELKKVRNQGFAMDEEECELGVRCTAFPIYNYTNRIVATMSAFSTPAVMTNEFIESRVKPTLRSAAARVSYIMGYNSAKE